LVGADDATVQTAMACRAKAGRGSGGGVPPRWPQVTVCHHFDARRQWGYGDYTAKKKSGVNEFEENIVQRNSCDQSVTKQLVHSTNLLASLIKAKPRLAPRLGRLITPKRFCCTAHTFNDGRAPCFIDSSIGRRVSRILDMLDVDSIDAC
jgi:hypothetical protein